MVLRKRISYLKGQFYKWRGRTAAWGCVHLLYTGGSLLYGAALAYLLPISEFGVFSYALSLFLLVNGLLGRAFIEASLVLGVQFEGEKEQSYIQFLLLGGIGSGLILGALLCLPFAYNQQDQTIMALLAMVVMTPFVQAYISFRRILFVREKFATLIGAALLQFLIMFAGLGIVYSYDALNPINAIFVMGIAGFVPTLWLFLKLELYKNCFDFSNWSIFVKEHWLYARWPMLEVFPYWLTTGGLITAANFIAGLESAGVIRIVQMFILPLSHLRLILNQSVLPFLAKSIDKNDHNRLRKVQYKAFCFYSFIGLGYGLAAIVLVPYIFPYFLGNANYENAILLFQIMLIGGLCDLLRAAQKIVISLSRKTFIFPIGEAIGAVITYFVIFLLWGEYAILAFAIGYSLGRVVRYATTSFLIRKAIPANAPA